VRTLPCKEAAASMVPVRCGGTHMQLCQWAAQFLCFSLIANVSLSFHRKSQGGSGVAGGSTRVFARPVPLAVARGKHITVDGISITNSPFWHSIIFESSYVTFKNIYMKSLSSNETGAPAANTDGCEFSCICRCILHPAILC
jgi:hypothetical protein